MNIMRYIPGLASMLILSFPPFCLADDPLPAPEPTKPVVVASVTPPAAETATVSESAEEPRSGTSLGDTLRSIRDEIDRMALEKEQIDTSLALSRAKLDKELIETRNNAERLQAQAAELRAQQDLTDLKNKVSLEAELKLMKQKLERVTLESNIAKAETDTEFSEIRRVENSVKRETVKLATSMELQQKQAEARTYAMSDPSMLTEPLQGRRLVISDRRVALNGPITMDTADQIIARISYYNNKDRTLPIFLIIDDSPGGSVMAGYKILKTMQGSEAPVYVVVKSFAASMAACLTTLAKKSFAYPNAVILHHQISAFGGGNLTQQQEWVKEMEEWWRRLADPVAAKMGITREEFIKQMYAHASTGDWNEFGDKAQALKWVDVIVDEIDETAMVRDPEARSSSNVMAGSPVTGEISLSSKPMMTEQVDEKGRPCMSLPRLNPLDCYWIYNPDGYFRVR